jgi:parallel beta-helix repeat protein
MTGARATNDYPIHNINTSLNYTSIQDAINANETLDGHTIHVNAGTYSVIPVIVNKSVSLVGEGRDSTIIQGSITSVAPIVYVSANNVTVIGFSLRDGCIGILTGSNGANYTHIANCTISGNEDGVYTGISESSCGGNIIEGNIILNNSRYGIHLQTSDDVVYNNTIANNHVGIHLIGMQNKTSGIAIWANIIENNQYGCQIGWSANNTVFHNNFINNTIQVSSPRDTSNWDNGYPSGGNYWSNYNGTDTNHDGIGDSPFLIDTNNTDHYPLMTPYIIPEFPSNLILALFVLATLLVGIELRKQALSRRSRHA